MSDKNNIPYQCDMFKGGGTDAGNAHLEAGGRLALVLGIPLRYCHGSYSMVHSNDLQHLIQLICKLIQIDNSQYQAMTTFITEG